MIMMIGNVNQYATNLKMSIKWQQKKNEGNYTQKEDQLFPELEMCREQLEQLRENTKPADVQAIYSKLQAGKRLNAEEMRYLEQNDPVAYQKAKEIEAEREQYERELKNCKTKEDVERLQTVRLGMRMAKVNSIANNPNIGDNKKMELLMFENAKNQAEAEVLAKFKDSLRYQQLPTEQEKIEEMEQKAEALRGEEKPEIQEEVTDMEKTEQQKEAVLPDEKKESQESVEKPDIEHMMTFEHQEALKKAAGQVDSFVARGYQAYKSQMEPTLEPEPVLRRKKA